MRKANGYHLLLLQSGHACKLAVFSITIPTIICLSARQPHNESNKSGVIATILSFVKLLLSFVSERIYRLPDDRPPITTNAMKKLLFFFCSLSYFSFAQTPDSTKVRQDIFLEGANPSDLSKLDEMLKVPIHQAFWAKFQEQFGKQFSTAELYPKTQTTSVDNWEMMLFDNRKAQIAFYKNYPESTKFSEDFKKYVENSIRWNYWHFLVAYPIVRGNSQTKFLVVQSLPSVMLENFDENKANDENALLCEPYRNFLIYYITYFNSKSHGFAKYSDFAKAYDEKLAYAREHLSGKTMQYWLARFLVESCGVTPPSKVRELYGFLSALTDAERYAAAVKATCGDVMNKKEEKPKEEKKKSKIDDKNVLTLTDLKGKTFTLDDFKGKVVYVDVWASWCGPCRQQFPFSKQLHEKLTDKQKKKIVFLYLSIDDTQDAWKKAQEQLQLPGEHGWAEGGWNSKIVQFFGIQAIPRYVLIDKNGNIANINAKRPSDETILDELLKLAE